MNIAAESKTRMGGGKTSSGKKIPREETATSSTRSMQTPFGVQEEGVSGGKGGIEGGMAAGVWGWVGGWLRWSI